MVTIFIFDCMTVQTSNTILVWQMSKAKWINKVASMADEGTRGGGSHMERREVLIGNFISP